MIVWITIEHLLGLHAKIIKRSGGEDGLRDRNSLEAALAAPLQTFGGQELLPGDLEKIARLGYGLAVNHAFVDGNKRMGAMAVQAVLALNGYDFSLRKDELAEMFLAIADRRASEQDLLSWLKRHL